MRRFLLRLVATIADAAHFSSTRFRTNRPKRSKRPNRWWLRCTQFSLRTLLCATTLAAIGCWWFVQPEFREEDLVGKLLTLRCQMRLIDAAPGASAAPPQKKVKVAEGRTQLWSQPLGLLASGQTSRGEMEGQWRTYYGNGHKAAEGRFFHGLRVGLWRTWHENGQLESEVTYAIRQQKQPSIDWPPPNYPSVPAMGMPLGSTARIDVMSVPIGKWPTVAETSQRHGPAQTWYASGRLRSQGSYQNDIRHGAWSLFDERGRLVEGGRYERGLREGPWTIANSPAGQPVKVEFIGSRPQSEYERLVAHLQAEIASGDLERQIVAIDQLDGLSRHGVPLLVGLLGDQSDDVRLMALRRLDERARLAELNQPDADLALPDDLAAKIEPLASAVDERVSRLAMLLTYRLSSERRERLFPRLIRSVRESREPDWQLRVLSVVYLADDRQRRSTFAEMAALSYGYEVSRYGGNFWLADLASRANNAEELVDWALGADEVRVRRFAVQVLGVIVWRGPYRFEDAGKNLQRKRFRLKAVQQRLLKRALADPDIAVRQAAEQIEVSPPEFVGDLY